MVDAERVTVFVCVRVAVSISRRVTRTAILRHRCCGLIDRSTTITYLPWPTPGVGCSWLVGLNKSGSMMQQYRCILIRLMLGR